MTSERSILPIVLAVLVALIIGAAIGYSLKVQVAQSAEIKSAYAAVNNAEQDVARATLNVAGAQKQVNDMLIKCGTP